MHIVHRVATSMARFVCSAPVFCVFDFWMTAYSSSLFATNTSHRSPSACISCFLLLFSFILPSFFFLYFYIMHLNRNALWFLLVNTLCAVQIISFLNFQWEKVVTLTSSLAIICVVSPICIVTNERQTEEAKKMITVVWSMTILWHFRYSWAFLPHWILPILSSPLDAPHQCIGAASERKLMSSQHVHVARYVRWKSAWIIGTIE